ncbi:MAG: aminotransferase class III-fold pyridoxal phosphate-dependent enzyme [Deltaproteobacteria bacterium]|nr:aminotransferase class III-fold pyridoxal phosphate-dependent enzyme [Deltaproteobacteria bacterium]
MNFPTGSVDDLNTDLLFYQTRKKIPFVSRAKGVRIWDHTGKEYIDGCSGAVINNIGHGDPRVLEAINRQAEQTFFVYRTYFENEPAVRLARKLVQNSAPHLERVFYVSGGSEAVESAMKICRQYHYNMGKGSRHVFISRRPAYHGATLGALALTTYSPLEIPFRPIIKDYPKIPAPYCYRCAFGLNYPECGLKCAWDLERVIQEQGSENVAAFVVEPIGGASTGALVPPDTYFAIIQDICAKYGIMLILDEVMTGFGRTGALFAYEHWNVKADVVALSKGMASGYYPLGAIMTTRTIVDAIVSSGGGFAHGHTYAGNPMACAVGEQVLDIVLEDGLVARSADNGAFLKAELEGLAERFPIIGQVRGKGLLTALELVQEPWSKKSFPPEWSVNLLFTDEAYKEGLLIYPRRPVTGLAGDHVLIAPPLTISREEIGLLMERLERALIKTMAKL